MNETVWFALYIGYGNISANMSAYHVAWTLNMCFTKGKAPRWSHHISLPFLLAILYDQVPIGRNAPLKNIFRMQLAVSKPAGAIANCWVWSLLVGGFNFTLYIFQGPVDWYRPSFLKKKILVGVIFFLYKILMGSYHIKAIYWIAQFIETSRMLWKTSTIF